MNLSVEALDRARGKDELAQVLRESLAEAKALRRRAQADPQLDAARARLRAWQAARLARTHADLLESPRFGRAAAFFLSDLYGPKDFSERDEEVERILPTLVATLPTAGVRAVALAVTVDALSEQLDAAMAQELQRRGRMEGIDDPAWAAAYRATGERALRERQLELIGEVGHTLDRVARTPLLSFALKLMRVPAHAAGLGALQEFLERGLSAFAHMGGADEFLEAILGREQRILQQLYAAHPAPFDVA